MNVLYNRAKLPRGFPKAQSRNRFGVDEIPGEASDKGHDRYTQGPPNFQVLRGRL